jgi:putative MFS transporter
MRIADHCTKIALRIYYVVEGRRIDCLAEKTVEPIEISAESLAGPRIDALPKVTSYQLKILIVVILGYWFEFYCVNSTSVTVPSLMTLWDMDTMMSSIVLTSYGWGMIVGALTAGVLSDLNGRKAAFYWSLAVFAIFTFLGGFAQNPWQLIATRIIAGWGMGGETIACTTLIQELFPTRIRGRAMSVAFGLGIAISSLGDTAVWILLGIPYGWQWVFWWGGAASFIVYILQVFWLPESPRWLQSRGRWAEAEETLTKLEKKIPDEKMARYREDVKDLATKIQVTSAEKEQLGIRDLLGKDYRKRTAVCWTMTFLAYMGDRGYLIWLTPLLMIAFGSVTGALTGGLLGVAMMVGASVIAGAVTDYFGRKNVMVTSSVFLFAFAVLAGIVFPNKSLFWYTVLFTFLLRVTAGVFYSNQYTYVSEQYPTRARSTAFGATTIFQRINDATAGIIFGFVISMWGVPWAFYGSATLMLAAGLIILVWGISTRGRTLEEISK